MSINTSIRGTSILAEERFLLPLIKYLSERKNSRLFKIETPFFLLLHHHYFFFNTKKYVFEEINAILNVKLNISLAKLKGIIYGWIEYSCDEIEVKI